MTEKASKQSDKKKIYLRIDFENCVTFDFDYTIVADINVVKEYLTLAEDDITDDCKIIISAVLMTEKEYDTWLKKHVPS